MLNTSLKKEVNFLKVYSGVLTIALLITIIYILKQPNESNFEEINVERINIIEPNGDLKLVISNSNKQHSGVINGQPLPQRERQAGLIFFNSVGDECGGLVYAGNDNEAGLVLSVDKYRDDQVMQLRYIENTETNARAYGMQFWDYPMENGYQKRNEAFENLQKLKTQNDKADAYLKMKKDGLLPEERMFVGKKINSDVGLFINDTSGNPRIRIYIDKNNTPKIELLNEDGTILGKQKNE